MSQPIYFVGGGKGGVGKSIFTLALMDYLTHQRREPVLLVETDTSNPDVSLCYPPVAGRLVVELINLDQDEGWMELANLCEQYSDHALVINSAARNHAGINEYGKILSASLTELQRELIVLWVINTQRDSLQLLKAFMDDIPESTIHVIRNLYHGKESQFELYNTSQLREILEGKGGYSLNFPKLAVRVAHSLFSDRLSIEVARGALPIGNRVALLTWRQECANLFGSLIHGTHVAESV